MAEASHNSYCATRSKIGNAKIWKGLTAYSRALRSIPGEELCRSSFGYLLIGVGRQSSAPSLDPLAEPPILLGWVSVLGTRPGP